MMDKISRKKEDVAFCAMFIAATGFLIWKTPYGFGLSWADEPYILSTGHRLLFGDGLLAHEWFPAQLQGFLLYPIFLAWRTVVGDTTGMILGMRYLFLSLWGLTAVVFYLRMRSRPWAGMAAVLLYLHAPLDVMNFSYNTIGQACFLLTLVVLLTGKRGAYFWAGVSLAAAVLCTPTLLFWFILYSAVVLLWRKGKERPFYLEIYNWAWLFAGSAAVAVVFMAFLFLRCGSLQNLLVGVQECLQDGEHQNRGLLYKIAGYPYFILRQMPLYSVGGAVVVSAAFWDTIKGGQKRRNILLLAATALSVICAGRVAYRAWIGVYSGGGEYSTYLVPPVLLGIVAFIYTKKRDWHLFWVLFVGGFIYSFAIHYTSNLYIMAISHGLGLCAMASLIFCGEFYRENREVTCTILRMVIFTGCVFLLLAEATTRAVRTVGSIQTAECTVQIEEGSAKGLWLAEGSFDNLENHRKEVRLMDVREGDIVFFNIRVPMFYLDLDKEYGCYTAWAPDASRQLRYWKNYPEKLPDSACLYKTGGMTLEEFAQVADLETYTVTETDMAWVLNKNRQ